MRDTLEILTIQQLRRSRVDWQLEQTNMLMSVWSVGRDFTILPPTIAAETIRPEHHLARHLRLSLRFQRWAKHVSSTCREGHRLV